VRYTVLADWWRARAVRGWQVPVPVMRASKVSRRERRRAEAVEVAVRLQRADSPGR
jgi:hypothetical protein